MTAHAPGPWRVIGTAVESCKPSQIVVSVASIGGESINPHDAKRLIDQAPRLLEALEDMVLSFAQFEIYDYQSEALEAARVAIHIVKGGGVTPCSQK